MAALLLVSATPTPKPANYNAFGIAALQHLAKTTSGNVFISPVSIGMAMSMAADGAAGTTRAEIVKTLGIGADVASMNAALAAALKKNPDAQVGLANAIWTRADIPPSPSYVKLLAKSYGATAQALHFGDPSAAQTINQWTKAHTFGLIPHLVDDTTPYDFAFLTNALSFEGKWTLPFAKSSTHSAPFTPASGAAHRVQMMSRSAFYQTVDEPAYRAVRMPYGKGGYAAYILLPSGARAADTLLASLTSSGFDRVVSAMAQQELALSVPRFTATYRSSLNSLLQALGIHTAFTRDANFSPMHKAPPRLRLSNVDHAAFVRVDEKGTVAAAATSAEMEMQSVLSRPKPFIVDHSFIFAIRDERTGALLFIGLIRDV